MSFFGGDLSKHEVFKKNLSIGFEFETHEISKFVLHENGKILINSAFTLTTLKNHMISSPDKYIQENENLYAIHYKIKDEDDKSINTLGIKKSIEDDDDDDDKMGVLHP